MDRQTILIVDNDAELRGSLCEGFKAEGYKVFSVPTGEEAVKLLDLESIDFIILELQRHKDNSFKILEEIKLKKEALPVIITGECLRIEETISAIKKGAYDILDKPFSLEKITALVNRAWEHR
jgi:DNA-binding NtrC family response regulator